MKTNGKIGSILLAGLLAVSMLPVTAFADDGSIDPAEQVVLDEGGGAADTAGEEIVNENIREISEAGGGTNAEAAGEPDITILTDDDEDYEDVRGWGDSIYVLGQRITNENCDDILGDGGSVVYDHDSRTITLTDAVLDLAEYQSDAQENNTVSAIDTFRDLHIVLKGENLILSTAGEYSSDKEYVYGITASDELTISGSGVLDIVLNTETNTAGNTIQQYYGIDSSRKLIVDRAAVSVLMAGKEGVSSSGIYAGYRGFDLKNGASVIVQGYGSSSTALYDSSFGTSLIEAGSRLELSSPNRAFTYSMLAPAITAQGAIVNTEPTPEGAAVWDRVTRLDNYKYICIPEPIEDERGFGDNIYVLGTLITDENCSDVLNDGTVKYDKESNTLTLTNAKLDLGKYVSPAAENNYVAGINSFNDLNIVLNGYNTVFALTPDYADDKEYVYGITADGELNISGEGMLDIAVNTEKAGIEKYYGIDSLDRLTVDCSELTIVMEGMGNSTGIYASWNGITVKSGSSVMVMTDGSASTALYDTSFGKSTLEGDAWIELFSDYRAFQYTMLNDAFTRQGAVVNGRPTPDGAFEWDGTTRLSAYKYVRIPSNGERGWGDSVFVLGRKVTEENYTDVLGDGGSVRYDHESKTLTLANAVLDLADYEDPSADNNTVTGIDAYRELNVVLVGENKICSEAQQFDPKKEYVHGISATGELNISGNGTLDISIFAGENDIDKFYGIDSWQQLNVSAPKLTVNMTGTGSSTAVDANWNGISVSKGSEVHLYAEGEKGRALYDRSFGKSVVEKGAVLEMTANNIAFDYAVLPAYPTELGAFVNTAASAQGAYEWDKTTRLSTYKYVCFPYVKAKEPSTIVVANKKETYTGKPISHGKVSKTGSTGKVTYKYYSDKDCTKRIAASDVVNVGTYYVIAILAADDNYKAAKSAPAYIQITKATQTVKSVTPTAKTVKKAGGSFTLKATASKEQGKASFAKQSGNEKITVSKAGKVTVAKGLTSGNTYTLKVKVRIAGTTNYKTTEAKTFRIRITIK